MFADAIYTNSNGCSHPINVVSQNIIGICSENQIQKNDSYCTSYCVFVIYLSQVIGLKIAVLKLYSQTYS